MVCYHVAARFLSFPLFWFFHLFIYLCLTWNFIFWASVKLSSSCLSFLTAFFLFFYFIYNNDRYVISFNQIGRNTNQIGQLMCHNNDNYIFDKVGIMLHGRNNFSSKLVKVIKVIFSCSIEWCASFWVYLHIPLWLSLALMGNVQQSHRNFSVVFRHCSF